MVYEKELSNLRNFLQTSQRQQIIIEGKYMKYKEGFKNSQK